MTSSVGPWTWVCVMVTWGVVSRGATPDKEAAVRDVFREMLHISPPRQPGTSNGRLPSAPRHMVELYHRFVNGQEDYAPLEGGTTTVRNFLPSSGGKDTVVFNISSVNTEEEVRLAQLQLNRRKLHQRHRHRRLLAPPYRIRLFRASPGGKLTPLGSVSVSMVQRSVWTSVDITAPLRELLLDPRGEVYGYSLAVRFESPSGKVIPPSHFLRGFPDSHAFLVVFSEDGEEEVTEDGGRPPPKPPVHTHALVQRLQTGGLERVFIDDSDNNPDIIPNFKRRMFTRNVTLSNSLTTPPTVNETHSTLDQREDMSENEIIRKTRSIIDNKLPDENEDLIPVSSPESFLTSRIDIFNGESRNKKPKKVRKGKRKGGKKQKNSYSSDRSQNMYMGTDEPLGCQVRKMTVNFSEIGWGEWIISPRKFEANYCTGSCRFPLTEENDATSKEALKPSNHATLQSLVHALGADPRVPAPACVPHRLSPVTLLYFDHTLNVVLKNYPSMVVESCACR
ncbi:bone morphogenetic protein 3-like [Macrosteles quadrilineatus]|uniref:bone morphogenetic protein 3-like n=1 Tax=Macrosteles quadrilineatus TaxID=74068 RepID=UPI0023E1D534|nr:bone morphogenetic protein 3-like [Macrosteles quadrilineatus]